MVKGANAAPGEDPDSAGEANYPLYGGGRRETQHDLRAAQKQQRQAAQKKVADAAKIHAYLQDQLKVPPPLTISQQINAANAEKRDAAKKQQMEEERIRKTAASTAKLQQEISERDSRWAETERKNDAMANHGSGKGLPSIFTDPQGMLTAMRKLDACCKYAVVQGAHGEPVPTKPVAEKCKVHLLNLAAAIRTMLAHGERDLKKIMSEHSGWLSKTEVNEELIKDFANANARAGLADGKLNSDPPAFFDAASQLVAALRFNQRASDAVANWSKETIDAADKAVTAATFVRDTSLTALEVCVIIETAPGWGAELAIHGAFSFTKAGLKASDSYVAGKPVPWKTLTAELTIDIVLFMFGKWFEKGLEHYLEEKATEYMIRNGAMELTVPQVLKLLGTSASFKEMKFLVGEEIKSIGLAIFGDRSPADEKKTVEEYVDACLKKEFSWDHVWELYRTRWLEKRMDRFKEVAKTMH